MERRSSDDCLGEEKREDMKVLVKASEKKNNDVNEIRKKKIKRIIRIETNKLK